MHFCLVVSQKEAAKAHDFFQLLKKRSILACKVDERRGNSCLRPSSNEPLKQGNNLAMAAASRSPDDSDMEMEDDISQVNDDEGANHSFEGLDIHHDIKYNMSNVEEQLYPLQISEELTVDKGIMSEKEPAADILGLGEQGLESICNADVMAFGASVSEVTLVKNITVSTEQPLVTTSEKPNTSGQLAKGVSRFRLLQDHASDDNSGKDVDACVENSSVPIGANLHADAGSSLENANSLCKTEKAFGLLSSNMPVKNVDLGSSLHKVDKFGRLVRDGGSDSDSDEDSHYLGRHRMGRTRGRSPSHSPPRRRRRRSRQRRWDKRSRSRSWSPRNRRSRSKSPRSYRSRSRSPRNRRSRSPRRGSQSRSPNFRRAGEFNGENKRRMKGQMPDCFDFQRGRCYRGASCRYMHHDSGKNDGSRQQKSKQQFLEFPRNSRSIVHEEIKQEEVGDHKLSQARGPEVTPYSNNFASRDKNTDQKREDSAGAGVLNQDSQCTEYPEVASDKPCLNADCLPKQSDNSSISDSSLQKKTSSPNRLPKSNAHPNTMDFHNHPSHIPSPSFMRTQGVDNPHLKQQPIASSVESFPSYMLPSQSSFFVPQSSSSLNSLPPPPPLSSVGSSSTVNAGTVAPGVSSHIQQIQLPLRNDFGSVIVPRSYPTELPAYSQSNGFQQQTCLPIQERNQPFLHASLPVYNLPNQQFGAPSISRNDGLKQPSMQNFTGSNSFAQGNSHPHAMPVSQQMLGNRIQTFPIESSPAGGILNKSSYIHPSQQQQLPPCLHHPMGDGVYNLTGKMNSTSKDTQDIKDTASNQAAIGGPIGSAVPNSYVSTIDQSINSKYSINALSQVKDITYSGTPFTLSHATDEGRDYGMQQAASVPNSTTATGQIARSGGDQYDPLFDSIEPSPKLSIKFDFSQKLEMTGDSDVLLGLSGSNKPLDMEESIRKDVGAFASAASTDNEEFGETADAEVDAVENGSPSDPVKVNNMATGEIEIEIDQVKSPGKSKERKDSRSMKLFKVALADFVKEVLKPSWRQGNMSKEAFKTIVKKAVDKASGAMKSHQIPKSRAKIDQYIESSQRKLTKLVMGYVDKYVKV